MQRNSTYNKIFATLTVLKSRTFKDVYAFSEHIPKLKLDEFEIPTAGGTRKKYSKPSGIRRTIYLSVRLGLVDTSNGCSITSDRSAASKNETSFKNVLGAQVISYLDAHGFGIQTILNTISQIKPPDLPEAKTIYEQGKSKNTDVEETEFRKLLYLLALCDRLDREGKYLYFER